MELQQDPYLKGNTAKLVDATDLIGLNLSMKISGNFRNQRNPEPNPNMQFTKNQLNFLVENSSLHFTQQTNMPNIIKYLE